MPGMKRGENIYLVGLMGAGKTTVGRLLARLRELYAERDSLYRGVADLVVETGSQSVQALARELLEKLEEQWKASA